MNIPINHHVIRHDGLPVAVVVPFEDYEKAFDHEPTIPHDVIMCSIGKSMIQGWREYLGLTQKDVADRMGISQPAYSKMEAVGARLRGATIRKIANALGVDPRQIVLDD